MVWSWCLLIILGLSEATVGGPTLGDAALLGVVLLLLANISDNASIAALSLFPVSRNGFAASGFCNAVVNSSNAVDALSADAVVGMVYFSGKNTTVSDTLVFLVLGM